MNIWQWLYDIVAVIMLAFYVSAFLGLEKSLNIRKTCLACSIYIVDTIIGILFTLYFVYFWFSQNDSAASVPILRDVNTSNNVADPIRRGSTELSQSASPTRELFLTVSGTILITTLRVYFSFVFLSFTKLLLLKALRNKKYFKTNSISEEAHYPQTLIGNMKKFLYGLEARSKEFLEEHLLENERRGN